MLKKIILIFSIILGVIIHYGCATNKYKHKAYEDMKSFVLDDFNRKGSYLLFF